MTWTDNATNEASFRVERSPLGAGSFAAVATVGANSTAFTDTTVTSNTGYDYRVYAVNGLGDSSPSNVASVTTPLEPPSDPTLLTAQLPFPNRVDLSWQDNSSNETSFRVERREGAGAFSTLAVLGQDATSYSDGTVVVSTGYEYRVFAVNADGDSGPSNTLAIHTAPATSFLVLYPSAQRVFRVNLPPTSPTLVAQLPSTYTYLTDMALGDTDTLYLIDHPTDTLITWSLGSSSVQATVTIDVDVGLHPRGFAISPGGELYVVDALRRLRTLDPVTGATTLLATITGAGLIEDLAFAPDGTCYAIGSPSSINNSRYLYTLETSTGVLTLVGQVPGVPDIDGVTFTGGKLYGVDANGSAMADLWEIDPQTAGRTTQGNTGVFEAISIVTERPVPGPEGLVATPRNHRVVLTWEDLTTETGYRIERSPQGAGTFSVLGTVPADTTTYRDLFVPESTTFDYRVVASTPDGDSEPATVTATTLAVPPVSFAVLAYAERNLYRVRTDALGSPTLLGAVTGSLDPANIAATSPDELLVLDRTHNGAIPFSVSSGTVSGATLAFNVDVLNGDRGLTLSPHGVITVIARSRELMFVQPTSGIANSYGAVAGPAHVEALAWDPWGNLYALGSAGADGSSENLYLIDVDHAQATLVGPHGAGDLDALTWGPDGFLYGVDAQAGVVADLYRIDPVSGAARNLGSTGVTEANGIECVPIISGALSASPPHVRRTFPPTLVSGTTTELILHGSALGGATSLQAVSSGVTIVSQSASADGELLRAEVRTVSGALSNPVVLQVTNGPETFQFHLESVSDASTLTVGQGEVVRLAGTSRLGGLDVREGGTLRGVGLHPFVLDCDGRARVEGTVDVSGEKGFRPKRWSPAALCGRGGDGGPGGGGGGGGGASHPVIGTDDTAGAEGGWGLTGGGGGGGANHPAGDGGLGAGGFGSPGLYDPTGFAPGGNGGAAPVALGGGAGGGGGDGGGGGGTGNGQGQGGLGGPAGGQAAQTGAGGGAGGHHVTSGTGGGGGSYGTSGENGRTNGGPAGLVNGTVEVFDLVGGSGGGGGSGRGGFEGLAAGGGGGGGAVALLANEINVSAAGSILANGGQGGRHPASDGEGGSGSGGAVFLQAQTIDLASGARVEALGGPRPEDWAIHHYRGAGGAGRVRADALTYRVDGAGVTTPTFAAESSPTVGFFGVAAPTVTASTPGASSGAVPLTFLALDADGNRVRAEVEYSVGGGPFQAATLLQTGERTFAMTTAPAGVFHTVSWDSAADLGSGSFSVVFRVRLSDTQASAWSSSGAFSVSN